MSKLNRDKIKRMVDKVRDIRKAEEYLDDSLILELVQPKDILEKSGPRKKILVITTVPLGPEMTPKGFIQVRGAREVPKNLSHANYPLYSVVYGVTSYKIVGHGIPELKKFFEDNDLSAYVELMNLTLSPSLPPKHWDYKFTENNKRDKKGKKVKKKKDKRTSIQGAVDDMMKQGRSTYVYPPDCTTDEQRRKYRAQQRRLKKKGK